MRKHQQEEKNNNYGSIEGGVINIGGTQSINGPVVIQMRSQLDRVSQQVSNIPHAQAAERQTMSELVNSLKEQIERAPAGYESQIETLVKRLAALTEALEETQPEPELVKANGESLKKAAENIAGVLPVVLKIVSQIVPHALSMIR
jgi:TolA-binding protein